jgi:hypothetical protein
MAYNDVRTLNGEKYLNEKRKVNGIFNEIL